MLLVDEVNAGEDGRSYGKYTVRGDEFFLQGHFPEAPVVPGVILCEMASQASCAITAEETRGKLTLFAGMDRVRFKAPVRPGDTVEFVCEELRHRGGFHVVRAEGRVEDKVCLCGEFTFFLADPKEMK